MSIENFLLFPSFFFLNKSSLRISHNRICCINYSLQRLIGIIYNWYIDTKEGIQVFQVACFVVFVFAYLLACFMADRFTHTCYAEQPELLSHDGWQHGLEEILRQAGVCAEPPKNTKSLILIMLCSLGQAVGIREIKPKEKPLICIQYFKLSVFIPSL